MKTQPGKMEGRKSERGSMNSIENWKMSVKNSNATYVLL